MISRPSFKFFSWHTSLVGLIGTSIMMFFISPILSAVSILLCLSLILALNFFSPVRNANWGSISQALLFHQVSLKNVMSVGHRPVGGVSYHCQEASATTVMPYLLVDVLCSIVFAELKGQFLGNFKNNLIPLWILRLSKIKGSLICLLWDPYIVQIFIEVIFSQFLYQ